MDLGILGKFFLEDKSLRFLPYTRTKKRKDEKRITIKNLIEMSGAVHSRQIGENMKRKIKQSYPSAHVKEVDSQLEASVEHQPQRNSQDGFDKNIEISQKSFNKSVFSNVSDFTSPVKRAPKPIKETALMNEMFGAGTDPLALDQDFSKLASNGMDLMNAVFYKPAYAKIRCPPVIDTFCRTLASPVASQYNSLSASSRIALFYSTATKYLYFDTETKGMSYLKIKENKTN